jgi:CheY-like chemotaxis protein
MINNLPLFYYPTTWVYVDDDNNLLQAMGLALNQSNDVKLFQSPKKCLDFLIHYQSPLEKHSFLKSMTHDENYGLLQWSPVDFDVTRLAKLIEDKNRHSEVTVIVIDYHMPEMDGFTLAQKIQKLPIQKIMLTGDKQENKAIEGFNKNLIQRFLQKGVDNLAIKLLHYLKELSTQYFRNISSPLLSYLETDGKLPLSDPIFIDYFETYIEENNIVEYYLIDKEGSFLCINSKRKKTCLVVRTESSINALLEIYKSHQTLQKSDLDELKEYKKIPFFGIGNEAWHIDASQWDQHLYSSQLLEGKEKYFICTVNLN